MVVGRIQPPVPAYSREGDFHYAHPDAISSGKLTEEKQRHNAKIKTFISKKTNASAREVKDVKTCDDFDCEKLVKANELENLYVSQLVLYLMANFNLLRKDCEKKGFKKASKIENIKKHLFICESNEEACTTSGNSCDPASDWTNQRSTCCTPSSSLGWYSHSAASRAGHPCEHLSS